MGINLGSASINNLLLGETQVDKVYLGEEEVWSNAPTPVTVNALKFTSENSQTLGIFSDGLGVITPTFEYSTDGTNWSSWDITTTLPFGSGTDLYIRGTNSVLANYSNYTRFIFSTNSPVYCSGNVMHLFDYTQDLTTFPSQYGLKNLFNNATALVTPPSLPATTLAVSAYEGMFYNCYKLTSAPALPALTLTDSCYRQMFRNCVALTQIPALPATTLYSNCYRSMFDYASLIKVSDTQSSEYPNEFTFGATPNSSYARDMFINTGGTLTTYPTTSTIYTSNQIIS